MDIGLETEEDICDQCDRAMANCKFVGECEPEIEPDTKSEEEHKTDMAIMDAELKEALDKGQIPPYDANDAHIRKLKYSIKMLIKEKNFYLTKVETLEKQLP